MHSTAWQHCFQSWHCPRTCHPVELQQQQQQHTHPPITLRDLLRCNPTAPDSGYQLRHPEAWPDLVQPLHSCMPAGPSPVQTLYQRPMHSTQKSCNIAAQPLDNTAPLLRRRAQSSTQAIRSMVPPTRSDFEEADREAGQASASCPAQVQHLRRVPAPRSRHPDDDAVSAPDPHKPRSRSSSRARPGVR
jgi:hypothetical protein